LLKASDLNRRPVPKLSVRAGMAQGLRPGKRPVIAIDNRALIN
jgi:hypothetical protein